MRLLRRRRPVPTRPEVLLYMPSKMHKSILVIFPRAGQIPSIYHITPSANPSLMSYRFDQKHKLLFDRGGWIFAGTAYVQASGSSIFFTFLFFFVFFRVLHGQIPMAAIG